MRTSRWKGAALAALMGGFASVPAAPVADLAYLYDLADFTGRIPYSDARVVVDPPRGEVYTVYANEVRVFNNAGMEIYRFELDLGIGRLLDVAVEDDGGMLMLVFASGAGEGTRRWAVLRADFRGRPLGEIAVGSTGEADGLLPNRLLLRAGRIWLLSQSQMRAASYLPDGKIDREFDLGQLAGLAPEERSNAEVSGMDVGGDGTIVFAVPVQFRVHAIDPGGGVRTFGKSGSAAGNFGVLGDLVLDGEGNIYLADRQRSVVMVFNRAFRLLREVGRVAKNEWLARPGGLALDPSGRLYVSQVRNRGIAVFGISPAPLNPAP